MSPGVLTKAQEVELWGALQETTALLALILTVAPEAVEAIGHSASLAPVILQHGLETIATIPDPITRR
jgi:hypothetical protein